MYSAVLGENSRQGTEPGKGETILSLLHKTKQQTKECSVQW